MRSADAGVATVPFLAFLSVVHSYSTIAFFLRSGFKYLVSTPLLNPRSNLNNAHRYIVARENAENRAESELTEGRTKLDSGATETSR